MPSHEERAREIGLNLIDCSLPGCASCLSMIEAALAEVERDAYERAAKVAEAQIKVFLSPEYATGQPLSSLNERFACEVVAQSIRSLIGGGK